jgi:hypothetical protein
MAQMRRDRYPGPACSRAVRWFQCRSADLRDRAGSTGLRLPRWRPGVLSVGASLSLRRADLAARNRCPEAALSARVVRRDFGRVACDHRARLGFGHVFDAHSCREGGPRLEDQRNQDLYLEWSGRRRSDHLRGDRSRQGFPRRGQRLPGGRRATGPVDRQTVRKDGAAHIADWRIGLSGHVRSRRCGTRKSGGPDLLFSGQPWTGNAHCSSPAMSA